MATVARASPAHRGLAFLAGVGFAAVPTVGPYLALLAIASGRLDIQRADRWWWLAALLLGAPFVLTGHAWSGIGTAAQVLATWLIFRAAAAARHALRGTTLPRDAGVGLLVGFAGAMALGLERSAEWRLESARSAMDLIAWTANPALFGHAMVLLAALLAVVVTSAPLRAAALAMGAVAAVASGTQEAALAWLLVAVGLRLVGKRGGRGLAAAEWALIGVVLLVTTGLGQAVGVGRTGFRFDLLPPAAGANLFRGTEVAAGEWWYALGVDVAPTTATIGGVERTAYLVTKTESAPWSRLQQIVELRPGRAYLLSVAWRASDGTRPGLDGFGRSPDDGLDANLAATYRDGAWVVSATPHFSVTASEVLDAGDGWARGTVAFRYEGTRPLVWYVGAVPDRSGAVGVTTTFTEYQLVEADAWVPYVPNAADVRLTDLRTTRFPMWREALQAIAQRPALGWGPGGFAASAAILNPADAPYRPVAAHAHNLPLDTWVERGAVGLLGLLLLAAVLGLRAVQQRDGAMLVVLAAVLLLNLFETTLLNGALIYPLAAVLGWRSVGSRSPAHSQTGLGSAASVRVALAAGDVAVAALAISVGLAWRHGNVDLAVLAGAWNPALAYATLLWPAFAWAFGLYPGYGQPLHAELDRHARASVSATAALGLLQLAVPDAVGVSGVSLLWVGLVTLALAPVARALVKSVLRSARLWGRPVVMVGTGPIAERVARYLLERPEVGLTPTAAFGDQAWGLSELAVTGRLAAFWQALPSLDAQHAIVTPEAGRHLTYDVILQRAGHRLRFVQFVPDLHGLPASAVTAAPLGTSLGLEMRNRLASTGNRAVKRTLDLLAVVVGGVLALPLLAVLAIAVRLDSQGPALYRQERIGRQGHRFRVWKFRTMVHDADARLAELLARDDQARTEWEASQKLVDDPRITRIGRFLRRTSLDELPQLWNVVTGEMSLVGPRPIVAAEVEKYGDAFDLYAQVRPGITGFWQVSGRSDTSYDYRVELDAYYVRNWSVWLDVEILLRTVRVVLQREGAY